MRHVLAGGVAVTAGTAVDDRDAVTRAAGAAILIHRVRICVNRVAWHQDNSALGGQLQAVLAGRAWIAFGVTQVLEEKKVSINFACSRHFLS